DHLKNSSGRPRFAYSLQSARQRSGRMRVAPGNNEGQGTRSATSRRTRTPAGGEPHRCPLRPGVPGGIVVKTSVTRSQRSTKSTALWPVYGVADGNRAWAASSTSVRDPEQ